MARALQRDSLLWSATASLTRDLPAPDRPNAATSSTPFGQRSIDRLQGAWPNLIVVHTPIHASWLNQAEIYFSVVQRKVVSPNDFADLDTLERQLLAFGRRYQQIAAPFQWKFTRHDLDKLLTKTDNAAPAALAA